MSSISRELFLFCTNMEECGATYRATLAYLNVVTPSRFGAAPRVPLAIAPARRRAANDDHSRGPGVPPHANENDSFGEATG